MNQGQILKGPVVSEKSLALASLGKYTFKVDGRANKKQITKAVEEAFGVHVVGVKTINLPGKKRRAGPRRKEILTGRRAKVIVKVKSGEKIDLFTVPGQEEAKAK